MSSELGSRLKVLAVVVVAMVEPRGIAAAPPSPTPVDGFRAAVSSFQKSYCSACHGPTKQEGNIRFDNLSDPSEKKPTELAVWASMYEQLDIAQMPPSDAPQPPADQLANVKKLLRKELSRVGKEVGTSKGAEYPSKGNLIAHEALFGAPSLAVASTPPRVWRMSPFAYREFADDLTGGRLIVQGGPSVRAKMIPLAATPFGLTTDAGFRDYAFRCQVSGSESQQLAANAKLILEGMMVRRPKFSPSAALTTIANATGKPNDAQLHAAVKYTFEKVLHRAPTDGELIQHAAFANERIEKHGNRDGLVLGLVAVFLHPEAVFRFELGAGPLDEHGRLILAPTELAVAIAYALTDSRPDDTLLTAARNGKLASRDDVRREVERLLADSATAKPRILRFFREFFGYDMAPDVFKDPRDVQLAGINNTYNADDLVTDTDMLVQHVLKEDRDVLKELLTTDQTFVGYRVSRKKGARSPFGTRPGQSELYKHYNFALEAWSEQMPMSLPSEQRSGILTQPAWLIAHSANTENHAIHRGKWVRERLLGGSIPDTPITVEAKLPDEPEHTLRHRMRVSREEYCFKCHRQMDPLGLPFEMFDHLGQFRTMELGKPVDTSGEVVGSGDPKLDGKVTDALELIRNLAASERVEQVFVRHAFRYWMGRNETADDARTLQAAHLAYRENSGSMNALILSLLTSDSFLYRRPSPPDHP